MQIQIRHRMNLRCLLTESSIIIRMILLPNSPLNRNGLVQLIRAGKSTQHKWVNQRDFLIIINFTRPSFVVVYSPNFNRKKLPNQSVNTLIRRPDLDLHCLHMSPKRKI